MPISQNINNLIEEINTNAFTSGFGRTKKLARAVKRSFDPNMTPAARAARIRSYNMTKIIIKNTKHNANKELAKQDSNDEYRKLQERHRQGNLSNNEMIKQAIDKSQSIRQAKHDLEKEETQVDNPKIPGAKTTAFKKRQYELSGRSDEVKKILKKHLGGQLETNTNQ